MHRYAWCIWIGPVQSHQANLLNKSAIQSRRKRLREARKHLNHKCPINTRYFYNIQYFAQHSLLPTGCFFHIHITIAIFIRKEDCIQLFVITISTIVPANLSKLGIWTSDPLFSSHLRYWMSHLGRLYFLLSFFFLIEKTLSKNLLLVLLVFHIYIISFLDNTYKLKSCRSWTGFLYVFKPARFTFKVYCSTSCWGRNLFKSFWETEKIMETGIFSFLTLISALLDKIHHLSKNQCFVCTPFEFGLVLTSVVW